jgi:hypothetical protein
VADLGLVVPNMKPMMSPTAIGKGVNSKFIVQSGVYIQPPIMAPILTARS